MLSRDELVVWYERLQLPAEARAVIDCVRSSDPARRVGGGRRNVTGRYPSKKMGVTVQFERPVYGRNDSLTIPIAAKRCAAKGLRNRLLNRSETGSPGACSAG